MAHHLVHRLGLVAIALVIAQPSSAVSPERTPAQTAADPLPGSPQPTLSIRWDTPKATLDPFISVLAIQDEPDPTARLQALDAWARHPGDSLDPVTYALVDPDESVRNRAQELLEQELGRR
jgi:hypothetical protein